MVTLHIIKHTILHFTKKLESIQYKTALAITNTIRGTSQEKLYNELALEALEKKRW